ncbi:MAG: hypothetical protein ACK5LM_00500 [Lactovum sp.]
MTKVQAEISPNLLSQQQEITQEINENRSKLEDLQDELLNLEGEISKSQESVNSIARTVQTSGQSRELFELVLSSSSFSEVIQQILAVNSITKSSNDKLINLRELKEEKEKLLDELNKNQDKLEEKKKQLESSLIIGIPNGEFTPKSSVIWLDISEEQARANIVARESSGDYQAENGRYYGAYQLDRSYLNGDFSPENQDATAQAYVIERYGSWANAWSFWLSNHWY